MTIFVCPLKVHSSVTSFLSFITFHADSSVVQFVALSVNQYFHIPYLGLLCNSYSLVVFPSSYDIFFSRGFQDISEIKLSSL